MNSFTIKHRGKYSSGIFELDAFQYFIETKGTTNETNKS